MTHADAFLQDILAHPDDDAPRLIFADWLEEQGDAGSVARAEFIRVQCTLVGEEFRTRRRWAERELQLRRLVELKSREQHILEQYGNEWAGPIRRLVHNWTFHRGFINEIAIWDDIFLAHADRIFRRVPIQHLHIRRHYAGSPRPIAALADHAYLRQLRSLDLSRQNLDSDHVRALVVSEHLIGLTLLDLSRNQIGDSGLRALAEAPLLLARLTHLDLNANAFGTRGVRALVESLERLAQSSGGLRLQKLGLLSNNAHATGRRVLADSPVLRHLTGILMF
jgi:uncharacterized protein (TIGR02996 family)